MIISGGKITDPSISDGLCEKCFQPYCVIVLEESKARNGICSKCNTFLKLTYRRLIVDDAPLICPYCKKDPVYVERDPGRSIFVIEPDKSGNSKINRHLCDLEWEQKHRNPVNES
jgi:hypothetical protein